MENGDGSGSGAHLIPGCYFTLALDRDAPQCDGSGGTLSSLVGGVPACSRGVGTRRSLRSLPTLPIL